jgi:hypothetical protein
MSNTLEKAAKRQLRRIEVISRLEDTSDRVLPLAEYDSLSVTRKLLGTTVLIGASLVTLQMIPGSKRDLRLIHNSMNEQGVQTTCVDYMGELASRAVK